MVQQIFTLVPLLNLSLGFVTAQENWSTENTNNNKKKEVEPWLGRLPAPSNNNNNNIDNINDNDNNNNNSKSMYIYATCWLGLEDTVYLTRFNLSWFDGQNPL